MQRIPFIFFIYLFIADVIRKTTLDRTEMINDESRKVFKLSVKVFVQTNEQLLFHFHFPELFEGTIKQSSLSLMVETFPELLRVLSKSRNEQENEG